MKRRRFSSFAPLLLLAAASSFVVPIACGGGATPDPGYRPVTSGAGGSGGEGEGGEGGSSSTTGSASGGGSGDGGAGVGGGGGSGGAECVDIGISEPNETEASATKLTDVTDCDADSMGTVTGVLKDAADVDWYKFSGSDGVGCTVDPTRDIASPEPLAICKYIQCVSGTAQFDCPSGTTSDASPDGHPGCCGTKGFDVSPDCDGISDDATVLVKLTNPGGVACLPYTMNYHY